jgi:glyoxylase-like metal-dependent hydrolase (beta-lactamase superfamily II)
MLEEKMYEVYAIRYATAAERRSHENFIQRDMHDGPMPLDFYIWLIKDGKRNILVDTGFNRLAAEHRNRRLIIPPEIALEKIGVDPASITDIIITHLHWDHAGNLDKFPQARFHIQEREMAYATGRCMCHAILRQPFDVEPVVEMVRHIYAGRTVFHCGHSSVAPDIDLHWVGGHSDGLQIVRVQTARGSVVLASDAAHFYDNMRRKNPFPLVYNVGDMIQGWQTVATLAEDETCIIPGHDPAVTDLFSKMQVTGIEAFVLHERPDEKTWKRFTAS